MKTLKTQNIKDAQLLKEKKREEVRTWAKYRMRVLCGGSYGIITKITKKTVTLTFLGIFKWDKITVDLADISKIEEEK